MLVIHNFKFSQQKVLKTGEVFWRCTKKGTCKAKVFTVGPDNLIVRSHLQHNHEADEKTLNRQKIASACKRKAIEDIAERPAKIIRNELKKNLPETITSGDIRYITKNIYNARRKVLPGSIPKNIVEVHNVIDSLDISTNKNENFVFINDEINNIIVFSCETNLRNLCEMESIYMDGTFSYCTKYFYQFFTIHGLKNGHYIPLVFALLPDKREETYKKLFEVLRNKIRERYLIELKPLHVFVDFEKAIHSAVKYVWSATKIHGCRFHLHQAWFRKVQNLGLVNEFRNRDSSIGKWLKYCFGLTYLNPQEVGEFFALELWEEKPRFCDATDKFADYLVENYIDENSMFPPQIWATTKITHTLTTNACESFHSRFNGSFYSTHPSIYIFIEKLKEFQIDTYIKLQSVTVPAKIKDFTTKRKLNAITQLYEQLSSKQITTLQFVKCISHYSSLEKS